MICPECGEKLRENDTKCRNCGAEFDERVKPEMDQVHKAPLLARIAFVAVGAVAALLLIVLIVSLVGSDKGRKTAEKLAKGIGDDIGDAGDEIDFSLTKQSNYEFLNELTDFSRLCSSDDEIEVEGIKLPEWTIYCTTDETGNLETVSYYNFTVLEKNWRGPKEKAKINVDGIDKGMTLKEVKKYVSPDPYIITYTATTTVYQYRYYFEDVEKNEACHSITVIYDSGDEVIGVSESQSNYAVEILTGFDLENDAKH